MPENNKTENPITIDLLNQGDTKSYDKDNVIQRHAITKTIELIKIFKENTQDQSISDNSCFQETNRVHNTILVHGKRGAGKSTFAMNLMKQMCDNSSNISGVEVLGIIDPTLIESKEHIFLNIIGKIYAKIEKKKKNSSNSEFKEVKKSLHKLARGLSLLDGVGKNQLESDLWDSPELILEEGLSNAIKGSSLERDFHDFLEKSLKFLDDGKSTFFLVFDDIDTSADQGIKIMEVLRKYLSSEKLIVMLLGDIALYTTLVRQMQWRKFDPHKIIKDYEFGKEREDDYRKQIDHLEDQYMVKILKPENRIELKSLDELQEENKNIQILGINEHTSLKEIMKNINEDLLLVKESNSQRLMTKLILSQPTRSVIQVLQAYRQFKLAKNTSSIDFTNMLKHTFYSSLKELKKYELLEYLSEKSLLQKFSLFLLDSAVEDISFTPNYNDDKKNLINLYLTSLYHSVLFKSDNNQYLSFFIKVGYVHEIFSRLENKDKNRFIQHTHIDREVSMVETAQRLLTTFDVGPRLHKNPMIYGSWHVGKSTFSNLKNDNALLLTMSSVYTSTSGTISFISFFNLLAIVSDLLQQDTNVTKEVKNIKEIIDNIEVEVTKEIEIKVTKEIEKYLKNNVVITSHNKFLDTINANTTTRTVDNEEVNEDDYEEENKIFDQVFLEEIFDWIVKAKEINAFAIDIFSKILLRSENTFQFIEGRLPQQQFNTFLHRYIIGFLNAVLVETKPDALTRNATLSDKVFITNMEKVKGSINTEEYQDLFDVLYHCPIWGLYINPQLKESIPSLNINLSHNIYTDLLKFEVTQKISFNDLTDDTKKPIILEVIEIIKKEGADNHKDILRNYNNYTIKERVPLYDAIKHRLSQQYTNIKKPFVDSVLNTYVNK